ncbi:MAG: hypothetical protein H3C60_04140 [Sphingomonadaceae bacterium]|nr:hypothetical protein [Sphingomonadaceae bacterium]
MIGGLRKGWIREGVVAAALFLVLFARILVPSGYMPVATADGVVVTLCTGNGPVEVLLDLEGGHVPTKHDSGMDAPCAFAGMGAGALAAAPVLAVLVAIDAGRTFSRAVADLTVHRLAAPPPPAIGPPARA